MLFLVSLFSIANGQDITLIRRTIQQAASDTVRNNAYQSAMDYFRPLNSDSAYYYGEQGLKAAIAHKDLEGEAMMIELLGRMDQEQGRIDLARQRFGYALKLYQRTQKADGIAAIENSLGAVEATVGNSAQAMPHFLKAQKLYDSIKINLKGIMTANMNIGCLYLQGGDTANGARHLAKAEQVSRQLPLSDLTISLYNYIGVLNLMRGNQAAALDYFTKNVTLSDKPEFMNAHVEALCYLGSYYNDIGERDKSMSYLEKALNIATEKKFTEWQADILLQMGTTTAAADPDKGLDFMLTALATSEQLQSKTLKTDIYKEMARVYEARGDYKTANELLKNSTAIKDSMQRVNKTRELSSLGAVYELERSNNRIEEVSRQRNIIIFFCLLMAIALIAVVVLYQRTKKLNVQLVKHEAELIDLSNTKDKLFSIIGHDLRWPVARIPTILDIVDDESLKEDEKKYLIDSLKEHTKATVETLDKLLYWGKSLMNGVKIAPEWFNPKQYILETIELRRMAAADKEIKVIDKVADTIEIYYDPSHFDFIIRNIFSNAIKFTALKGEIVFDMNETMKPDFYVFSITDTGIGIDAERLIKIFEPFNSKAGTANEKGTGIGLMLCKEFAVRNGGDIWATSTPGKGSTFYLSVKKTQKYA